jgi:hypothetical protein
MATDRRPVLRAQKWRLRRVSVRRNANAPRNAREISRKRLKSVSRDG